MANKDNYWVKREREHALKQIKDEKILLKRVERRYKSAYDAMQKEINQFYSNYAGRENITIDVAKQRANDLDIKAYAKKAKKYVAKRDFSKIANDEMRLYNMTMSVNRLELLKANLGLEMVGMFDDLDKYYSENLGKQAQKEFNRQAGILGKTAISNQKVINQIVNASFNNATYSQRIWTYQASLKSELDKLLVRGLTGGKNPTELAREIRARFGVSRAEADRLLITEMSRVQSDVQKHAYEEYGYDEYDLVAEPSACDKCKEIAENGPYEVAKMQAGVNSSPLHPYCKCSTSANSGREAMERDFERRGL